MRLPESFVVGITMYSKIPMRKVEWNEKNMKYALCFFPVVGVVIGICTWFAGTFLLDQGYAKGLFCGAMTLIPVLISGGIHMDGFMDTLDARNSYGDRERKLEILKDPHAGAFAVLGLGCYLVWSMAVWSEEQGDHLKMLAWVYVMSRALSGYSVVRFPSARNQGLGKTFQAGADKRRVSLVMLLWFTGSAAGMIWSGGISGVLGVLTALVCFGYYYRFSKKEFGGMTGDLAGYFLEFCELAVITVVILAGGVL